MACSTENISNGWTPVMSIIDGPNGSVIKIVNWIGGSSNKPKSNVYLGGQGFVEDINDAHVIATTTGPQGPTGAQGRIGLQGVIGVQGRVGDIGPEGQEGPQGPQGRPGTPGQNGSGANNEYRYATNGSFTVPPDIQYTAREPQGWTLGVPTNVLVGRYVWEIYVQVNPDTGEMIGQWSEAIRVTGVPGAQGANGTDGQDGQDGAQGQRGPSMVFRGDWSPTKQYYGNPDRVDVVKYVEDGLGYLTRTDVGPIPIGTLPTDTNYFNEFTSQIDALFTDFLFAWAAYIDNLTVGSLKTALTGTRMEILFGENRLKFYKEETLAIQIGLVNVEVGAGVDISSNPPVVGPITQVDGAVVSGDIQLTKFGLSSKYNSSSPVKGAFYNGFISGPRAGGLYPVAAVKAKVVGLNIGTIDDGSGDWSFGGAFNSLFLGQGGISTIEEVTYSDGGITRSYFARRQGFTGTTTPGVALKFIGGVCFGPVT